MDAEARELVKTILRRAATLRALARQSGSEILVERLEDVIVAARKILAEEPPGTPVVPLNPVRP